MDIKIKEIKLSESEIQAKVVEVSLQSRLNKIETSAFELGIRVAQTMILSKIFDEQTKLLQGNAKA